MSKKILKAVMICVILVMVFLFLVSSYASSLGLLNESPLLYSIPRIVMENGSGLIVIVLIAIIFYLLYDISKRKVVEKELREKEERLRILVDSSPNVVCFKDGEGRWLEANRSCEEVFGLTNIDFKGKSEMELAALNPAYNEAFRTCAATDEAAWKSKETIQIEEVIESVDGKRTILDIIKVPVYGEKGEPKGLVILGRNITQRKLTEWKLTEAKERYKRLIQLLPIGILIHDQRKILFANIPAARMFGHQNPKELIGESGFKYIHPEFCGLMKEKIEQVIIQGKTSDLIEVKGIKVDGTEFDLEVSSIVFPSGGTKQVLSIFRDITEQKKAKELKEKIEEEERCLKETLEYDRLKVEFFANLSHELKTPLNLIFSTMQLLELTCNTYMEKQADLEEYKKMKKRMNIIKQNCYRMVRLVNNLIDVSKMESGYYGLNLRNGNIISIIEDITMSAADYVNTKQIQLIFDTDTEEKFMACDPDKIERIILNLLSNAIKFTDPGGTIEVNIYELEEKIKISIKDSGTGIPTDMINTIFDRFRQADKSFTRNQEGSGIGLTLVKTLVEMHGGSIDVQSELGKGTEFIIELPVNNLLEEGKEIIEQKIKPNFVEKINIEFSDIYSQ